MKVSLVITGSCAALIFSLSSCATISKNSCMQDSWYDVGFKGAMENHDRADHISDVTKICGKLGVTVDRSIYNQGFAQGTTQFCDPDNGYQWGLKGKSYNGICASPSFSAAYTDGTRIYQAEQRRNTITTRLTAIRDRLAAIDTALDEKTLTEENKRKLEREGNALLQERDDLIIEQRRLPRA